MALNLRSVPEDVPVSFRAVVEELDLRWDLQTDYQAFCATCAALRDVSINPASPPEGFQPSASGCLRWCREMLCLHVRCVELDDCYRLAQILFNLALVYMDRGEDGDWARAEQLF
jgi:hypothetical protein